MKHRLTPARLSIALLVPLALTACKKEPAAAPSDSAPPTQAQASTDRAGTIEATEDGAVILKTSDATTPVTALKDEAIPLMLDGKAATYAELKPGWTVLVHMSADGKKVASIDAFTPDFARERLKH
ncbi:MAG TPA: hypothetical protein VG269_22925 [Tepidisphaeraceae bacterium]|jgi:hypothetical protein|nr:hypothetical protein [Tepidisphaeraceae bacterium]